MRKNGLTVKLYELVPTIVGYCKTCKNRGKIESVIYQDNLAERRTIVCHDCGGMLLLKTKRIA